MNSGLMNDDTAERFKLGHIKKKHTHTKKKNQVFLSVRMSSAAEASGLFGPRQANLVLIAYTSSEGSGEPAHPRSLARTFAARSYKQ